MLNEAGIQQRDIASWGHDARNRLNVIVGYASLLEMDVPDEAQRGRVREFQAAAREIKKLLDTLEDQFSSPDQRLSSEFHLDE